MEVSMLSVRPIDDREAINTILRHPAIAPKLRHDSREPGYIEHDAVTYWGAYVGSELVGVFPAVRFSRWEIEAHVAILPAHIRSARKLCATFIGRAFEDPEVTRITAYVLGSLPSAANLCRKLGFTWEGCRRDACRVDGNLCDVLIFGITRQDRVLRA